MKTHDVKGNAIPKRDSQEVAHQKRLLGQFYRQARRKQWSRLQSAVHQRLERTDRLHHLMREGQLDG